MSIKLFLNTILNNETKVKQVPKIGFNLGTVPNTRSYKFLPFFAKAFSANLLIRVESVTTPEC